MRGTEVEAAVVCEGAAEEDEDAVVLGFVGCCAPQGWLALQVTHVSTNGDSDVYRVV